MTETFKHANFFFQILFNLGTFFSSKALGRDPEESDLDEVVLSESETKSDEEDKSDDPKSSEENNHPIAPITDNSAEASPLESASQQIELLPLLSDPDASVPENELIERDFQAMEEEHRQVA